MNAVAADTDVVFPHISVLIATCNRATDLRRCLDSVAAVEYPRWDVIVVDQSDDDDARDVVTALSDRLPPLRYLHLDRKGLSRARNAGLAIAGGDIIAFVDDDCTVSADWLRQLARVMARYPTAGLVFGAVASAPHDPRACFIPGFAVPEERELHGQRAFLRPGGAMGASMSLRRATWRSIGPFDDHLGAGADVFHSAEDWDYAYRVLAAGHGVVETPAIRVLHYGARQYESKAVSRLIRGAVHAHAAIDMKLLRCGDATAALMMAAHLCDHIRAIDLRNVVARRGPTNVARLLMYLRGLCDSFRFGVDRRQRIYVMRTRRATAAAAAGATPQRG